MNNHQALCQFAEQQAKKWTSYTSKTFVEKMNYLPAITFSSQAGSGGTVLAKITAEKMGFDHFNRELLEVVAKSAEVTPETLEHLEKERFSGIQDFISSLLDEKYLWPGVYLEHLKNMIHAICQRGHAVIVGRGANFILPSEKRLSVRVVAPLSARIDRVAQKFEVSPEEAKKRIEHRESRRTAFIKQSFEKDIGNPVFYDLVLNSEEMGLEAVVDGVCSAWFEKFCRIE